MKEKIDNLEISSVENLFNNVVVKYANYFKLNSFDKNNLDSEAKQNTINQLKRVMNVREGINGKQRGITPFQEKKFLEILNRVPQEKADFNIFHNLEGPVNYFGIDMVENFTRLFPDYDLPEAINHLEEYGTNKYLNRPKDAQEIWKRLEEIEKPHRIKLLEPLSHAFFRRLPINLSRDSYRELNRQLNKVTEERETRAVIVRMLIENTPLHTLQKLGDDILLSVWRRMGPIRWANKIVTTEQFKTMSEHLTLLSDKLEPEYIEGYIKGDLSGILIPGFEDKLEKHLKFSLLNDRRLEFAKNEAYKSSGKVKFPAVIIEEDPKTHLLSPWSYPLSPFQYRLVMLPHPNNDEMRFKEITEGLKRVHRENLLSNICNLRYTVRDDSIVVHEVENILQRSEIHPHLKSIRRKEFVHAQNALLRILIEAARKKDFKKVYFPTSGHIRSVFEGFFHPEVYDEIAARHGGFKCEQANIEADGCRTRKWHVIHL